MQSYSYRLDGTCDVLCVRMCIRQ